MSCGAGSMREARDARESYFSFHVCGGADGKGEGRLTYLLGDSSILSFSVCNLDVNLLSFSPCRAIFLFACFFL